MTSIQLFYKVSSLRLTGDSGEISGSSIAVFLNLNLLNQQATHYTSQRCLSSAEWGQAVVKYIKSRAAGGAKTRRQRVSIKVGEAISSVSQKTDNKLFCMGLFHLQQALHVTGNNMMLYFFSYLFKSTCITLIK